MQKNALVLENCKRCRTPKDELEYTEKHKLYAEPIAQYKRHPLERTITDVTEHQARPEGLYLPNPPPATREANTKVVNEENTAQTATQYGVRDENEIRLVMVGKTGSGKSATGNTIMGQDGHFISKLSGGSVTSECKRGECTKSGRKIVLVDTPGLFDTQVPYERLSREIIRCVNMSTPGPNAFLLVIQISRFTDEEIETFNRLFDLFGDGMGNFAIILFTKLDDLEGEETTIDTYIEDGPKPLKELIKRCQGR